ncbi:NADH-quinone oxidoreductase subunit C [Actinomadura sp. 7K507]|uniref:NADH-quinone oxidoreductase subunit C n=1 Tax=Actinomadura sp. 7K507 TaxID=2530365 RepID=UPI0010437345|nr:NADH-quinone oxidoreductase subunit C [Actinomadura sp. 7K507]TDC92235.1 NADH-quinone oxidoreductase subunit C [Actinomadura sp. 7K507]
MSSEHPEQKAEQAADQLPAQTEEERQEQPVVRQGMFGAKTTGDTSGYGGLVVRQTPKVSAARPYGGPRGAAEPGEFDEIADELERALRGPGSSPEKTGPSFGDAIERVVVDRGELTFYVKREHLREVAQTMRDDPSLRFELCSGVSGVHYPKDEGAELHSVAHLLSITHNRRVRLETTCPDADPHMPSLVPVYPTSDWHERETYDFFGIVYDGHPALTRIEMPDDWVGHPQRKDYPLGGIPVEYRGAEIPPPDERRSYV